jgi:hypothetical protein
VTPAKKAGTHALGSLWPTAPGDRGHWQLPTPSSYASKLRPNSAISGISRVSVVVHSVHNSRSLIFVDKMYQLGRRSLGPALRAVKVCGHCPAEEKEQRLTRNNRALSCGARSNNSRGILAFTNIGLQGCSNRYEILRRPSLAHEAPF